MCFHIFSSRTRCWFGRFIAASWGMWDPMIWATKTPTNVYTSGHFYWLLLFLFGWWLLSVFSKLYCLFVVWNIFVFSISFIQRHYQIEYFPVFGDRRFCGWNLVCSWEYSICLRWVAKCWFRVCIYIYIRNRWYFELINYGNISPNLHDFKLNYSICWIRVILYIYIYGFLHFQWYMLFGEEWTSTISY